MNTRLRKVTRNRGQFSSEQGRLQSPLPRGAVPRGARRPARWDPQIRMETDAPGVHDLLRRADPQP